MFGGGASAHWNTYIDPARDSSGQSVLIGGGGFCRNMDIHADGTLVTGVDVYGAYIGNTVVGTVFRQLVTSSSMPSQFKTAEYQGGGVLDCRISPLNSSVLLMSYTPFDPAQSTILLSQDKGFTFSLTNFGNYTASPNGPNFGMGGTQPMLALDPNDINTAYVGTESQGLWVTHNLLLGPSATWAQVTASSFPTGVGVVGLCFDPNSGTTSGKTNRLICVVGGVSVPGIWYTNNAGTSWTGPVSGSSAAGSSNVVKSHLGSDGTYYASMNGSTTRYRFTSANVFTSLTTSAGGYDLLPDPNNPDRGVSDCAGGYLDVSFNLTAGTPTWSGENLNHVVKSPAGQPGWAEGSNDSYLSEGLWLFDPLKTSSSSSVTIGNGLSNFAIAPGQNIVAGDLIRAFQPGTPANFIVGLATQNSGGALTLSTAQLTSTTSLVQGTGNKTFSVASGQSIIVGARIVVKETSNNNNNMTGTVVSYNSGSSTNNLVINVIAVQGNNGSSLADWTINQGSFGGSGTLSSWTIVKERIWSAMGLGVLWTDDVLAFGQQQWNAQFAGIENLVANQVVWPPGGNPFAACWDRPFWNLLGPNSYQASYHPAYPPYGQNNVIFGASVDWASNNPNVIVGIDSLNDGGLSTDFGVTWNNFTSRVPPALGPNSGGGTIMAADSSHFCAIRSDNGGVYYTLDTAVTWHEAIISGIPPGNQVTTSTVSIVGSGNVTFIVSPQYTTRANLNYTAGWGVLIDEVNFTAGFGGNVVSYNSTTGALVINVTSSYGSGSFSNWIIRSQPGFGNNAFNGSGVWGCADRVNLGTYYAFDDTGPTPGIYRSLDYGQTWSLRYSGTFTGDVGGNPQIKAVPNLGSTSTAGHLFVTGGPQAGAPLYRFTDGGLVPSTVANVTEVISLGFGLPKPGNPYPAVYIYGKVSGVLGFWRSDDNCVSWTFITAYMTRNNIDPNLGGWIDDPSTIEGNPARWNSFIVGYQGSSFAWYGPQGSY